MSDFEDHEMSLDKFMMMFPDAYELTSDRRTVRYSNGEGEFTDYESVTFCKLCWVEIGADGCENPDCEYCVLDDSEDDSEESGY